MRRKHSLGLCPKRPRARGESGVVAVEFALLLPILVMLLLGVTTTGLVYSDHLAITNATREASRLGTALDYTTPSASDWASSVQQRVQQVFLDTGSVTTDQICVKLLDSSGTTLASAIGTSCGTEPNAPSSVASGSCLVKVWVRRPAKITLGVFPDISFNIAAQSVAYYGRAVGACTTGF